MNAAAATAQAGRLQAMLHGPVLLTLFRLATPNVIGLVVVTFVIGFDGWILGRVGADALAGIALVFPLAMLMMQMSAGGIGGAVTAAVARMLGAGRNEDAATLALHAVLIAVLLAAVFAGLLLGSGRPLYALMGGEGAALDAALAYSNVLFAGALLIWLSNTLAAIVRGCGNMVLPSAAMIGTALVHIALCPILVFGVGSWAGLGIAGAAFSSLLINLLMALVLAVWLVRGKGSLRLDWHGFRMHPEMFGAILRVGAPASLSPVLSNLSVALVTALIGSFGTAALAGYGVAARLEYVMVPIAFGFGTALTALVATNMGAGQRDRALRVTWSGGLVVAAFTGVLGISAAIHPPLWMGIFTNDPAELEFGGRYLRVVGAF
ncbi:MAG: MATE family efflux transporter [Sulfuritalea sp.]|nr:MATE family efflux transporter [Sulfuritalea sp.]